jgi:diguanylate cyclase (GGDEF)-like protein
MQNFFLACLGALAVGAIDVQTGADVHIIALYFLPLAFAGMRLGRLGAVTVALFSALVWLGALYLDGARPGNPYSWVANFITQGCAFLVVTMLVSRLSRTLDDERTLRRTDALTGLYNRSALAEHTDAVLALCRRQARPVCLVYIDLDNFKRANDTAGHAHGDILLRQCGKIIAANIRTSDVAARIGGDEFVILLPATDRADALEMCRRIVRALDLTPEFVAAGVTASFGVVADDTAHLGIAQLLAQADEAMYAMKRAKKDPTTTMPAQLI